MNKDITYYRHCQIQFRDLRRLPNGLTTLALLEITQCRLRSNQSLKLTEPAVDDFAARCGTDLEHLTVTSAQRTTWNWLFAAAA
jgi:hypothetical protein